MAAIPRSEAILIKPEPALRKKIQEVALKEKRKPGPMVLILLERYFEQNGVR